jgi:hypothetical protein
LFRNLQVGIVRVDLEDWIIESNDRAEELFGRKLPKPGVEGLPINFRDLIKIRLREIPRRGSPDDDRYAPITPEEVFNLRSNGQASSYYALSGDGADSRWLGILATPVMAAHTGRRKTTEVKWMGVFATITEVPAEVVIVLDRHPAVTELQRD